MFASSEIIFRQLLQRFGDFYLVTLFASSRDESNQVSDLPWDSLVDQSLRKMNGLKDPKYL